MIEIAIAIISLGVGVGIGRFMLLKMFKQWEIDAKQKSELLLKEAEMNAKNAKDKLLLEAKEQNLKLKTDFENETNRKKNHLINQESKIKHNPSQTKG